MPLTNSSTFSESEQNLLKAYPEIAVLIPLYNNKEALNSTVKSLIYSGFLHIVIVDDGSFDQLRRDDLPTLASKNVATHILNQESNKGIGSALNTGLSYIQKNLSVTYTARIDTGDIQLSNRLDKQVKFMQAHSNIGIVGTAAQFVDKKGKIKFIANYPSSNTEIRRKMALRCNLLHPTVMIRQSILKNGLNYPSNFPHAEDYAFFIEKMKTTEVANIREILTQVEFTRKGISLSHRKEQLKSRIKIIYKNFRFSPMALVGMMYTSIMLLIPYQFIILLKKKSI